MMAKITLSKDFKVFGTKLKKLVNKVFIAKEMKKIGEFASEIIKKRTRLGFGVVKAGADRSKLKSLSEKYKVLRQSLTLSDQTTTNRSNLTSTGQLLDSISVIISSEKKVTFGPTGERQNSNEPSNSKLAEYVSEQGRPFINLSGAEIKQIKNEVSKKLRAELDE